MEQIYKYRSFPASIASGYKLFRSNIRIIISKSWIEALALGLVFGLVLVSIACQWKMVFWCSLLALIVALVFWNGRLFQLIDGGTAKDKLSRSAKATILELLFLVLPLIGVPLVNVMMEMMLEKEPHAGRALATGFKHWGYLFLTLLMSGLIMALLIIAISIPLSICVYGIIADNIGIDGGDPSGLPQAFPFILLFAGTLTAFILLFVQIWQTYAVAYAHGAIKTRDERVKE